MLDSPVFTAEKGGGWFDGGAPFYGTYKTKDDKYIAVGACEARFYSKLIEGQLCLLSLCQTEDYVAVNIFYIN